MQNVLSICLLAGLFLTGSGVLAQGTLQFNQVKLVSATSETVPTGKVWKVENVAGSRVLQYQISSTSTSDFNPADQAILINGNAVTVTQAVATGAGSGTGNTSWRASYTYAASPTDFPLWLPAGTTLAASTNVTYISVIEFNIVP